MRSSVFPKSSLRVAACAVAIWSMGLTASAGVFDDDEARKAIGQLRAQVQQGQADDKTRMDQLAEQLNQLLAQQTEQTNQLRRSLLDLNSQIEQLKADLAKARGQDELTQQATRSVAKDLAEHQRRQLDLNNQVEERLRRLEPQKVSLEGREVTVSVEERRAYDDALATLRSTDFAAAVTQLAAFQKRFVGSAYSGHAQYWLGNALYGKGDVKEAAEAYRALVLSAPDHPRTPDALLQLSTCQTELKDRRGARKSLEDLLRLYPNSEAAQSARERLATAPK
jgi:tol-pal system protein YbgF